MTGGDTPPKTLFGYVAAAILVPLSLIFFGSTFTMTIDSNGRVRALEATYQEVQDGIRRINAKLDRLLEMRRP